MLFQSSKKTKVAVAMSGGVDSSVAALLLSSEKKYDLVGVYMQNWSQELPEIQGCPWEQDQKDAQAIADKLGIPFYVMNFEKEYYEKVVKYMLDGYAKGITPNPDVMCNSEIKFGIFLDKMIKLGFNKVATGHYARIDRQKDQYFLQAGLDNNKDQSYFLCKLNQEQLAKTIFPIGSFTKPQIRKLAKDANLPNADKKDSQGICFIGNVKVTEFLRKRIKGTPGNIIDINNDKVLGKHQGVEFFTLGQRQGIEVGGTGPYYVVKKDLNNGDLYVSNDHDDPLLYSDYAFIESIHWIGNEPKLPLKCGVRIRYRHDIIPCTIVKDEGKFKVEFHKSQRAVTPGQAAVFYDVYNVLGCGEIIS